MFKHSNKLRRIVDEQNSERKKIHSQKKFVLSENKKLSATKGAPIW